MNIVIRIFLWALGLVVLGASLVGCALPQRTYVPPSYEDAAYANAICADQGWNRVPDSYCPIGDDLAPPGYAYAWRYAGYHRGVSTLAVPYDGYALDRSIWTTSRPVNVTTINIHRGSFPADPPAGVRASTFNAPVQNITNSRTQVNNYYAPITDNRKVTRQSDPKPPSGPRPQSVSKPQGSGSGTSSGTGSKTSSGSKSNGRGRR